MSRDASSENEAAIAMKRLHALLAEHNISMTDLDGKEGVDPVDSEGFILRPRPWNKSIASMVARLYFCKIWLNPISANETKIMVVGTAMNREFAIGVIQMVLHNILTQMDIESGEYVKPLKDNPTYSKWGINKARNEFKTSFLNGASDRIVKRCYELIEDAKAGTLQSEDGNTLPVLASIYDKHDQNNTDFMAGLGLRKGRSSSRQVKNCQGHAAGTAAGNRVQLTRSLQARNQQRLLS